MKIIRTVWIGQLQFTTRAGYIGTVIFVYVTRPLLF